MSGEDFSCNLETDTTPNQLKLKKDFEKVKRPSIIKLLPVKNKNGNFDEEKNTNRLAMLELSEFVNDPFWVRIRRILIFLSILLFLTIFVISILIIVYAPACEQKNLLIANSCK